MNEDILFKRPLPVSALNNKIKGTEGRRQARYSAQLNSCLVCNDTAKIVNYGALSCQSCKTFFRRNGSHPQNVRSCSHKRLCQVKKGTRRYCPACRLAKCFAVGMSSDFIRKEVRKKTKHLVSPKLKIGRLTSYNRIKAILQVWISDQPDNNRPVLTNDEWKIVSNVKNALETYSAIPEVHQIIEEDVSMLLDSPFVEEEVIQSILCIHTAIRSFIQSTPDFYILTIEEQSSLFERNFNTIINLYSAVVFRHANVSSNYSYIDSLVPIYGREMMVELIRISLKLDADSTIISLLLFILTFSSNCSMVTPQEEMYKDMFLHGTYRLFASQNFYVELLWKYMVSQDGFYKSVFRFSKLMKNVLNLIQYSANAYMNNPIYHYYVNGLNEKEKELLIMNKYGKFNLWGRKDI